MTDTAVLSPEAREERMKALRSVIELLRPVVQQDGGDLALMHADVETGVVEVQLQGSCSSCAVSSTTLQAGVSRILRDRLGWVTEVVGGLQELDEDTSRSMGMGGYVPKGYDDPTAYATSSNDQGDRGDHDHSAHDHSAHDHSDYSSPDH